MTANAVDYTLVRKALLAEWEAQMCPHCHHRKAYHNEHGCVVGAEDDVTETCSCRRTE